MIADTATIRFDSETREWAVRIAALEMKDGDPAYVLASVALRVGCTPATLRRWMRDAKRAGGIRPGVFTNPRRRVNELEEQIAQLRAENARLELEMRRGNWGGLIIGGRPDASPAPPIAKRA